MFTCTLGNGLGLNQDGMTEALKPSAKFDVSGLGHKAFNDFQWWDHAFNRAAKAFEVKVSGDQVVVEKNEEAKLSGGIKTKKKVLVEKESLAYGSFCKSGTLTNGVVEGEAQKVTLQEEKDYSIKLTDEELFKMCDGLTAHKYKPNHFKILLNFVELKLFFIFETEVQDTALQLLANWQG